MQSDLKYSRPLRALHWSVVLVMLIAVATIEVLDFFPKGSAGRAALFMFRQTAGPSILALMALHPPARVTTQAPPPIPGAPLTQSAAQLTHGAFYVLMVGVPLLGLLALVWGSKPIQPSGLGLPLAVAQDKMLAHLVREVHELGAALVYIAVGLCATVALWYEFILEDRLLRHMIQCT